MLALREKGAEVWSTDVAVPLSRLCDIIGIIGPTILTGSMGANIRHYRDIKEGDGRPGALRQCAWACWRR